MSIYVFYVGLAKLHCGATPLSLMVLFICSVHTDCSACLSSAFKALQGLLWVTEKISEVTLITPKMVKFLKLFFILISFHSLYSHPDVPVFQDNQDVNGGRTKMMIIVTRFSSGILVIGGQPGWPGTADPSVEFWTAADPEEGSCVNPEERSCADPEERSCVLNDYPRSMGAGPTADLVSGQLVACYGPMCEVYDGREWVHLVATRETRFYHSSAVNGDRILLIGGLSRSTEWIPADGSPSQSGPFEVRHGQNHCTIQLSPNTIVVTGGFESEEYVTEYQLTGDATEFHLTSMKYGGRSYHACAAYIEPGGKQVIL